MKIITKLIALLVMILISTEIYLQIASFVYLSVNKHNSKSKVLNNSDTIEKQNFKYKFMFIGDSWTEGADALPGYGYDDVLYKLLTDNVKNTRFAFNNLARSSNNSSQALVAFTRTFQEYKPQFLIALFGTNNYWNTYDIDTAQHELNAINNINGVSTIGSNVKSSKKLTLLFASIINNLKRLRIYKLYSLIKFNYIDSKKPLAYGIPNNGNDFILQFFIIFSANKRDEAIEYLTNNYKNVGSYDDFFRYVLYYFGYDSKKAVDYLSSKNIYFPEKITTEFNQEKHDQNANNIFSILERQLVQLQELCTHYNISLIIQTYPEIESGTWVSQINTIIRSIATKHTIRLVDQEMAFRSKYSEEEWKNIKTNYHVTAAGYSEMAKNLYNYLLNEHLIDSKQPYEIQSSTY